MDIFNNYYLIIMNYFFRDADILFPSHSTSCNQKRKIMNTDDVDDLVSEFAVAPNEQILQKHFVNGASSGLKLQRILAVELYISKYDFTTTMLK